jgi:NAD(P)-dependent dehydrogenase (short-subunit alcohol dehydrogenase family)
MTNAAKWTADRIPAQAGRRVVVTGANSGIGFYTALELARAGAEVIVPARTKTKAEDALARIRLAVPSANVTAELLDLADLASVRAFAGRVSVRPLDLLINNAGVMAVPKREVTVDGFERQFGTNFLGPFALTALLMAALLKTEAPRVVTVASSAASFGKIEFDNLQSERKYVPMWGTYAQSKLADLIFALELQRRAAAAGLKLTSTAAHPGYAVTNLQKDDQGAVMVMMMKVLKPILSQDAAHGALPTLFAAVAPEAVPGGYYGPDGMFEMKGSPTTGKVPERAKDASVAKRLWSEAERLTGISFSL